MIRYVGRKNLRNEKLLILHCLFFISLSMMAVGENDPHAYRAVTRICEGSDPSISSDGALLAFQLTTSNSSDVGVFDLKKRTTKWVSKGEGFACHPAFGKDGSLVFVKRPRYRTAYELFHSGKAVVGSGLCLDDANSRIVQLTARTEFDYAPSFSPDGEWVYFVSTAAIPKDTPPFSTTAYKEGSGIMRIRAKGDSKPELILPPPTERAGLSDPMVSPDGKRLVWAELGGFETNCWRIALSSVEKPDERTFLTPSDMAAFAPAWSPDGRKIAFSGCKAGDSGWCVYRLDLETKRMTFLSEGDNPCWSPDGSRIFFDHGGMIFSCSSAIRPFEKIAYLDTMDFAEVLDVETRDGFAKMMDHVLETGADTVLVRTQAGAVPRYASAEEGIAPYDAPLNRRRLPLYRAPFGWLRDFSPEYDQLKLGFEAAMARGAGIGVHHPFEEAHNSNWNVGEWNLAHPQFWCRRRDGTPWQGHCSLAYPEVMAHKLRLVDEQVARGIDTFFMDLGRVGCWSCAYEYVQPVLAEWKRQYGDEPTPADSRDPRWAALVGKWTVDYIRRVRARLDKAPHKVRFLLAGSCQWSTGGRPWNYFSTGIDWRELAREGVIDGVTLMYVRPGNIVKENFWRDIERITREAVEAASGVPVYFPIRNYDFGDWLPGYGRYAKWAGCTSEEAVARCLEIARLSGCAGITMECVDWDNYKAPIRKQIREFQASEDR